MTNAEALGPSRESLSAVERGVHLDAVAAAWLNGELCVEIYREAREKYGTDYRAAFRALAKQRRESERHRT